LSTPVIAACEMGFDELDGYAAVVYDLDGTLVRLPVDWDAVATSVEAVYADAGVDLGGADLWSMFELADEYGLGDAVERAIANHERAGARRAEALPLVQALGDHDAPVGVCSLNCRASCRLALERHEVAHHVDVLVGRDSMAEQKPSPAPLLEVLDRLPADVVPAEVLFVGDSERDETAARRAGMAFRWVGDDGRFRD
jgi:phosphoglycolate phosphatase